MNFGGGRRRRFERVDGVSGAPSDLDVLGGVVGGVLSEAGGRFCGSSDAGSLGLVVGAGLDMMFLGSFEHNESVFAPFFGSCVYDLEIEFCDI